MTDITELAQSLKAAAENSGADCWQAKKISGDFYVIRKGSYKRECGYTTYQPIAEIEHKPTRDYVAMANPANVLALVEALEKARRANGYLREQSAEWERKAISNFEDCAEMSARVEELESQRKLAFTASNRWADKFREAERRIAELESRTVTVKLPAELYTIGELIRTQDNRITDQPMFVVFQKREIIGSDEHSPSRICWVWDGEEVSELRAKRLEALYQDGRDTRGYDRYAMQEVDEFVTACFTEHGCKDYLRQNGHNLRLPYIYACGSFRNNEYQLVRNWLAGIKVEAE
ncbi:TPA: ead/Ea22-like family protein [Klebsiella quasipneumoniae]|nr:ead/Ea22-like family protein [Klebsiella quasipneumoniae]